MMNRSNWRIEERGWWLNKKLTIGVYREDDGRWHGYVADKDSPENTVGFKTMAEAMADAEKRAEKR